MIRNSPPLPCLLGPARRGTAHRSARHLLVGVLALTGCSADLGDSGASDAADGNGMPGVEGSGTGGTQGEGATDGTGGDRSTGGTDPSSGGASTGGAPSGGGSSSGGTSSGGTSSGGTSSGGQAPVSDPYPCDGSTEGYDAVVTLNGSEDARAPIQAALDGLSSGRTEKQSVLVQGSGTISATSRINMPSYTRLNVCGTITAVGTPSGDNAPIYGRGRTDIEIPHLSIAGTPAYGMFFRNVDNLHLGEIDIRVTSGLGIRIDNHGGDRADKVDNIRIDYVYVEGTGAHGVETYGANNLDIGTVVARNTGYSGLLLNDSTNATVGLVDAEGAGTGTGYAAFRMANRNGRVGDSYPTNIVVDKVIARGGARGVFCVSESGGAHIEEVDLKDTGNNSVLIENCYNVTISGGTVSGGGDVRLAARAEFANNSDITVENLTVTGTNVVENPCGVNTTFSNISVMSGTLNVCN